MRANAAASLVALRASVESIGPCMLMGVAAPMLVPGLIAATSPAITTNTPAEAARAPPGVTQVMTGTREASMRLTMSRMLVSSPPGVSTSITSARSPLASARSIARSSARAETGETGPSSRTTRTRPEPAASAARAARGASPSTTPNPTTKARLRAARRTLPPRLTRAPRPGASCGGRAPCARPRGT